MENQQVPCPWCRGTGKTITLVPPHGMTGREYMQLEPPRPDPKLATKPCDWCHGTLLCEPEKASEFLELHQQIAEIEGADSTEIDYASLVEEIEAGEATAESIAEAFTDGEQKPLPRIPRPREIPEAD